MDSMCVADLAQVFRGLGQDLCTSGTRETVNPSALGAENTQFDSGVPDQDRGTVVMRAAEEKSLVRVARRSVGITRRKGL